MSKKKLRGSAPLLVDRNGDRWVDVDQFKSEINWQDIRDESTQKRISDKDIFSKIKPKTLGQEEYAEAIDRSVITLCTSPAGCGKTFIAVWKALEMLLKYKTVNKIILTRPTSVVGKELGFMPGSLSEKYEVYLGAFYDALYELIGEKETEKLIKDEQIVFKPIQFMRGCNWRKSAVIVDEAQNLTLAQVRLLMTRGNDETRLIMNGDITQRDGPDTAFEWLMERFELRPLDQVNVVRMSEYDICRSKFLKEIIERIGEG